MDRNVIDYEASNRPGKPCFLPIHPPSEEQTSITGYPPHSTGHRTGNNRAKMTERTTTCISIHSTTNIINAYAFTEERRLPLTAFVTVAWEKTANWSPAVMVERREQLFWNMAKWFRKKGIPAAYLWTMENSKTLHLHMNLAVHVPKRLFGEFVGKFPEMVPGYNGNPHAVKFTSDNDEGPAKFFFHPNQKSGCLKYFLKGMNHRATYRDADGNLANFADTIGVQHRGQQGIVPGKRAGVSHAIGPIARKAAGFRDRTDPDSLRIILAKVETPTVAAKAA